MFFFIFFLLLPFALALCIRESFLPPVSLSVLTMSLANEGCPGSIPLVSFQNSPLKNQNLCTSFKKVTVCGYNKTIGISINQMMQKPLFRSLYKAGLTSSEQFWTFSSFDGNYLFGGITNAENSTFILGSNEISIIGDKKWLCAVI
jgi:hypothetical protein